MPHKENIPQHAFCGGQCGKVVHFSSRTKLFEHLREKHGVGGFHRRGRNSRTRRQESRAELHSAAGAVQPQPVLGPHRQWTKMPTAVAPSPANGVTLPAKAPATRSVGTSPAQGAISPAEASAPAQGATAPSSAPVPSLAKAITATVSALPSGSRLVSPETGASLPEKASSALATAPTSPAEAPEAAGDLLPQITISNGDLREFAWMASTPGIAMDPEFAADLLQYKDHGRATSRFIEEAHAYWRTLGGIPGAKRARR